MTSTLRPLASSLRPKRLEVVVPGKFEVFARAPHRRLKMVVLPVLGLPMRTMRIRARSEAATTGVSATAGEDTLGAFARNRHDEDLPGQCA